MAIFEDGSYSSTPGIALLGKVMAGRCQMHYTRAAVGKGTIPEGETPKNHAGTCGLCDGRENFGGHEPGGRECQWKCSAVQINSSDVEQGFYATGILLYAADPDEWGGAVHLPCVGERAGVDSPGQLRRRQTGDV